MGLVDSVFGNKGAKEGAKLALARPTDIFAPGFGSIDLEWGKKTPARVGFNLDPRAANLNDLGYGLTEGAIGSLLSGGYAPGGYYGLGQQYDPFVSALFAQPGASSAFLDPRMAQGFQKALTTEISQLGRLTSSDSRPDLTRIWLRLELLTDL